MVAMVAMFGVGRAMSLDSPFLMLHLVMIHHLSQNHDMLMLFGDHVIILFSRQSSLQQVWLCVFLKAMDLTVSNDYGQLTLTGADGAPQKTFEYHSWGTESGEASAVDAMPNR